MSLAPSKVANNFKRRWLAVLNLPPFLPSSVIFVFLFYFISLLFYFAIINIAKLTLLSVLDYVIIHVSTRLDCTSFVVLARRAMLMEHTPVIGL